MNRGFVPQSFNRGFNHPQYHQQPSFRGGIHNQPWTMNRGFNRGFDRQVFARDFDHRGGFRGGFHGGFDRRFHHGHSFFFPGFGFGLGFGVPPLYAPPYYGYSNGYPGYYGYGYGSGYYNNAVTVWIVNSDGTQTPVRLMPSGTGYIGPQGEYYPTLPSMDQLRATYGY
jgi:hypothetical protein